MRNLENRVRQIEASRPKPEAENITLYPGDVMPDQLPRSSMIFDYRGPGAGGV